MAGRGNTVFIVSIYIYKPISKSFLKNKTVICEVDLTVFFSTNLNKIILD